MSHYLKLDIDAGIATMTLADPDASVNTVSPAWIEEMGAAFQRLRSNEDVTGIIVTSGKADFMAGADLKFILAESAKMSLADAFAFSQAATRLHRFIETCGKPVVAAMNGFALGGGYELALACHRRILADVPSARVGLPEVTVGLLPGSGGTQRLPRLIGVGAALPLILDGRAVGAAEALKLGLVDALVPVADLVKSARDWLETGPAPVQPWDRKGFAIPESLGLVRFETAAFYTRMVGQLSAKHGDNYPASIAILSAVAEGVQLPFDRALQVESRYFAKLLTEPTARNIIRTTFVNKGLAEKGARRPSGFAKSMVDMVGVLGAGMMGAGIALVSALAGMDVVLLDMSAETAEKGKAYAARSLSKDVEKGGRTRDAADAILARIHPTTDYAALKGCQLVVEAVFEDTAVKAEVTRTAEAALETGAVFATNTSTLPITGLASASARPDAFIGLHFFSPVERMALVEVIRGQATSDATLAKALDYVAQLRKVPIVVNDSRGFYTSRVFQTLIHEGAAMLGEGISPARIENAARAAGFPVGPLALLDEVTVDLPLKIIDQALSEVGAAYEPPCGTPVLRRMRDEVKRPGRKAGGGFYDYPAGEPKRLWAGLAEVFPVKDDQPGADELRKRLLYVQALESVRCLDEGVLTHPADADLGAVFGWGFPACTGGTLSFVDTVGLGAFVAEADRLAQQYGPRFSVPPLLRARAGEGNTFHG